MPATQQPGAKFTLVIPAFNDWASLDILIGELDTAFTGCPALIEVLVVDDGSSEQRPGNAQHFASLRAISSVRIMTLPINMGHQRAIALGLAHVAADGDSDAVLVMDADGEDRPEDARRLIEQYASTPDAIIVAQRTKRSESVVFKALYSVYKRIFRILTGNWIDFGNFSLVPRSALNRLVDTPETWNHLAATYVRTPVRRITIPARRGTRYRGQSRMNLPSLVFHAICAMSVFADILFARILIATAAMATLSVICITTVIGIRLLTDWAIPGWTTNALGFLIVFFIQLLILMLGAAFLLVNHRSNMAGSPASQYRRLAPQIVVDGITERPLHSAAG